MASSIPIRSLHLVDEHGRWLTDDAIAQVVGQSALPAGAAYVDDGR